MEVEHMSQFEIKKVTSINKTIRLPSDLIDKIEELSTNSGISFNQFVLQAVRFAMDNLKTDSDTDAPPDDKK
jgi:predicted DNA binding CopG/RHH family protein